MSQVAGFDIYPDDAAMADAELPPPQSLHDVCLEVIYGYFAFAGAASPDDTQKAINRFAGLKFTLPGGSDEQFGYAVATVQPHLSAEADMECYRVEVMRMQGISIVSDYVAIAHPRPPRRGEGVNWEEALLAGELSAITEDPEVIAEPILFLSAEELQAQREDQAAKASEV